MAASFPSIPLHLASLCSRPSTPSFASLPRSFPFLARPCIARFSCKHRISASWKEVFDPASGQPYYWNTDTNETTWQRPTNWRIESYPEAETENQQTELSPVELTGILLAATSADTARFGDVANQYRPQCFEDEFFEHLTRLITTTEDKSHREELEKLRSRLSNPLLRNPPPY